MIVRKARSKVEEALADTPIVAIVGPRQCGKSTLSQEFRRNYLTLDDPLLLAHAQENPADFLKTYPAPLTIDEIQRAPGLFLPLKRQVDAHRQPGSYLLTGSANVLLLPKIADSLAGRMEVIDLWPLSQAEIRGEDQNFIDMAFSGDFNPTSDVIQDQGMSFLESVIQGGFPEPLSRAPKRRLAWFQSYLRTLLDRDVRDLANIDGLTQLPKLLRWIASRAGEPLNLSSLARETQIPHTTLTRYVDLLHAIYLVHSVPAWSSDLSVRLARTPKTYMVDTGLASFLLQSDEKSLSANESIRHSLTETFVAAELKKSIASAEQSYGMYHLRTIKNKEVPFLIERFDGKIVAIDLSEELEPGPTSGDRLQYVKEIVGERFLRGVLLYSGTTYRPLSSDVVALPISMI